MEPDKKKAFETSLETRNFEIELFWKRSLFFWGFIASTFVAFAALYREKSTYTIVMACFGMVCSMAWTLANRGSKFWQENWETKVANLENDVTGRLFNDIEFSQKHKFIMMRAGKYSVSKLAIGLSDYTCIIWAGIIAVSVVKLWGGVIDVGMTRSLAVVFVAFTVAYCVYIIKCAKTSNRLKKPTAKVLLQIEAENIFNSLKKDYDYYDSELQECLEFMGAVKTIRRYTAGMKEPDLFIRLKDMGCIDLSLETLVVREEYQKLFTKDEISACKNRLRKYGRI